MVDKLRPILLRRLVIAIHCFDYMALHIVKARGG